jgi:hypothetical protein
MAKIYVHQKLEEPDSLIIGLILDYMLLMELDLSFQTNVSGYLVAVFWVMFSLSLSLSLCFMLLYFSLMLFSNNARV